MTHSSKTWEELLDPAKLQDKLICASLYVTAYEILKDSICERIRSFYLFDLTDPDPASSAKYNSEVLARNRSPVYASLDWLLEHEAVEQSDIDSFEKIKSTRNSVAHELQTYVLGGKEWDIVTQFQALSALLRKIEVWWLVNIEIPTNPDFDGQEIVADDILPGPVLMLKLILDVATGNQEFLAHFRNSSTRPA